MKANRLFIAGGAALSLAACGGGTELNTTLSGAAERPAVTTNASGSAKVTIDGNKLSVEGTYTGLSGNATDAHIHGPSTEDATGPVFCNLSFQANPSGTLGGSPTGAAAANACSAKELTDAQIKDFEDGKMYVNVHTAANPPGEIRGQLKK